jgi:dihydroorotase
LTDKAVADYDTNAKMNPPLRTETDRLAIIKGLADGTIDMIATDHAPHSTLEKEVEFDMALFGIIGLETSLSLSLKLVQDGVISMETLVEKMSRNPAAFLGMDNRLIPGNVADITVIDPDRCHVIDPDTFVSKSRNTPFSGMEVKGDVFLTMVEGGIVFQRS